MKEISKIIKARVKELNIELTEANIQEIGNLINLKVQDKKNIKMEIFMKVNFKTDSEMEWEGNKKIIN